MTKIDIFSGFLGAGKTTLIKKLIKEAYAGEQVVLVENEFGEIGIDGGFMQDSGIQITEMNSGCICCSLTGDFRAALEEVKQQYHPDRILIEPSGVGKLSDVVAAVESTGDSELVVNGLVAVVDAAKAKMYMKNFGEFFNNQVESAGCLILSRTGGMSEEKIAAAVALLREKNPGAVIVTTPWEDLDGKQILSALERKDTLRAALEAMELEHCHDDDDDDDECECGCHDHEHEHEHDEDCQCGCHDRDHEHEHEHEHHHHHHGHDADEVFASWGSETTRKFSEEELRGCLSALQDTEKYGMVVRAKGIVDAEEGQWFHFDYTPGEIEIRRGGAGVTGRLCVIGAQLRQDAVAKLFN